MIIKAYHLSRRKYRESILQRGLIPREGRMFVHEPRLFFADNREHVAYDYVDYENVDCWEFEIDDSDISPDPHSHSEHHFYTRLQIPPEKLTLVESIGPFPRDERQMVEG